MPSGISSSGDKVEEMFRQLTGSSRPRRAADGDAVFEGSFVEVKKASSDTVNQVRAVKFLPVVVFHVPTDRWFVVPPSDVVRLVAGKGRGQHTENPFESATLSVRQLGSFVTSADDLADAVRAAIVAGGECPELHAAMVGVLEGSRMLAEESKRQVGEMLARLA